MRMSSVRRIRRRMLGAMFGDQRNAVRDLQSRLRGRLERATSKPFYSRGLMREMPPLNWTGVRPTSFSRCALRSNSGSAPRS
jgi:hypothetical protein